MEFKERAILYYDTLINSGKLTDIEMGLINKEILLKYSRLCDGNAINISNNLILIGKTAKYTHEAQELLDKYILRLLKNLASTKIEMAMNNIYHLTPFYTIVLRSLKREYTGGLSAKVKSMGVNKTSFIVNVYFAYALPMSELHFILMHEAEHIAGLHIAREGSKRHSLWNEATDLYINKLLAVKYNLEPINLGTADKDQYVYPTQRFGKDRGIPSFSIRMPMHSPLEVMENPLLCCSLYNPDINLNLDTPESIYKSLLNRNDRADNMGDTKHDTMSNTYDGSDNRLSEESITKQMKRIMEDLNKSETKGNRNGNVISELTPLERETLANKVRQAALKAKLIGDESSKTQRDILAAMVPKYNLRVIFDKYLMEDRSKRRSYGTPSRHYLYRGLIVAGAGSKEKTLLKNVELCIDTSGSVSKDDLKDFFSLILSLLDNYRVSAEILYWDTQVYSGGYIKKNENKRERIQSVLRIKEKCCGGGGTKPQSLFKYFESEKCRIKPNLIVILTDGYFLEMPEEYAAKYGNVLWIITRNGNNGFTTHIGTVKNWKDIEH